MTKGSEMKKISVCMAVYNGEKYIRDAERGERAGTYEESVYILKYEAGVFKI